MNKEVKDITHEEEVWYIVTNNETKGPFSLRDLDVFLRTNQLNSMNLAWKVGMKEWCKLNQIEEIKQSILESSKEMLEIEKKRQILLEQQNMKDNQQNPKPQEGEDANDQIIENKDQNALTILQTTVEHLITKSFHQSEDGKWNMYDQEKGEWVKQEEEPTQKIQKFKQLLFNKLKNQLFFQDKNPKRKKPALPEQKVEPEVELTEQQQKKKQRNRKKTKRQAQKKKQKWYNPRINTFIYISGLPLDITQEELKDFVVKAGVLRIDLNSGKQKLKLYRDENGFPKGDAAASYAKQESVDIAIQNLNDKEIRSGFKIRIQKASFQQKQDDYKPRQTKRQSLAKKIQSKMKQKKQLSWDQTIEDEGQGLKIVILKHMIDISQANNDTYLQLIKKDITEEIQRIGQIQRIRFYQSHPQGVVEIKFKRQKDAQECLSIMNGRFFDKRQIISDYWDGQTDYKKDAASLQLQQERLEKFGKDVEQGDKKQQPLEKIDEKGEQEDEQVINSHLRAQN